MPNTRRDKPCAENVVPVTIERKIISCVSTLSLRAQRGIPVAVATAVHRRMFSLIEVATALDEFGMSGRSSQGQIRRVRVREVMGCMTNREMINCRRGKQGSPARAFSGRW